MSDHSVSALRAFEDAQPPETPSFLRVPGEMAASIRHHDWAATPLGPVDTWSQALRTLAGLMLTSTQPMFMAWGAARTWLYNDAFVPILGRKHPSALGRPALEVWKEARDTIEPLFDKVFSGTPVHMADIELELDRRGTLEEAHFSFSYTPARDDQDAVAGLFGVCVETTDRVLAERRQATANERQHRLFGQAPGFIAILQGPRHVFEFVNDAYKRLVGERPLIGLDIRTAFPEIEGQGYYERLDAVYSTRERFVASQVPVRLHRGTGTAEEVRLDFIYEPIVDDAGTVTGIFVEGHDVTAAWHAQRELRANERRQALLVELGDRFRELDDPTDISYAAAELLGRALGVSRAGYGTIELASETITIERDWNAPGIQSLAGTLRFRDYGTYIEDLKRGDTVVFADAFNDARTREHAVKLKAISAQSAINMPVTESQGLVAMLYLNHAEAREWPADELAFIREVAERTRSAVERRRAEKDLLALTASLEQQVAERTAERDRVWRHSRDLLAVIGADGIFRAVNPAWTTVLGLSAHEVQGRSFHDFVWPEDDALTQSGLDTAASGRDLVDFENRYRHRDGTPRWISWHTAVEGDIVYAYGRDITAQRTQAAALRQAEDALRQSQKLEAMGQLTGGVAHDFNNLLAVVSNNLFLHRRLSPDCAHSPQLAAIARATDTGARLTRQLLAFSRRQAVRPETLRLQDELPELRHVLQATLGGPIDLRLDVQHETPAVRVDRSELELAIINLAMNARDAMPQGGVLAIGARRVAPSGEHGEIALIEVKDTGQGIPPDVLSRVFEPFFTTKEAGRGTGLGLSQVYGFAKQSGGSVDIDSTLGEGTRVSLRLPAAHALPARSQEPRPSNVAPLSARVLVVEDNPEVGATTRELLQVAGCDALLVTNGLAARDHLASTEGESIDLVISDLVMPGPISGVSLAQWIREHRPELPFLLATGYSSELSRSRELGHPVLQKPVTPEALVDAVRQALRR